MINLIVPEIRKEILDELMFSDKVTEARKRGECFTISDVNGNLVTII